MAILPLLYRIQEIDSRMAALGRTLEELSQDPQMLAVKALCEELRGAVAKNEAALKEGKLRQRQQELELRTCQERLKHEENRLYGGTVAHARELEQIQQKITEYHTKQSIIEEELLKLMEEEETLSTQITELNSRLDRAREELHQLEASQKAQTGEILLENEQLQWEFDQLAPQIPVEWLARYKKIAKAHRGIGIAKLKQNSCGACHVSLSEFRLQQVKRGEDKLNFCENCGRILFY